MILMLYNSDKFTQIFEITQNILVAFINNIDK